MKGKTTDENIFTFEARNFRFITVRKPTILNEYVLGPITVKHLLALLVALFLFGVGNKIAMLNYICITLAVITIACALYPPKALSLETMIFGAIITLLDMIAYNNKKKKVHRIELERVDRGDLMDVETIIGSLR